MIKVNQIRTGVPMGQCTEACYASILGVPLEEVPDLFTGDLANPRSEERWLVLHRYLKDTRGLKIFHYSFERTSEYAEEIRYLQAPDYAFHTICGWNPEGVKHMVVGYNGEMVWDPNPKRLGLVEADGCEFLLNREEAGVWFDVTDKLWAQEGGHRLELK